MKKKETQEPLRGEKLLKTAINQILLHPETWEQSSWHSACGTKHCLAGWCQLLAGKPKYSDRARIDAQEALEISSDEANVLFASDATISQMHYFAENFDRDGFDRAGFDRAGKKLTPFDI